MPPKKDDKGEKKPQTKKVESGKASSSKNPQSVGIEFKYGDATPRRHVMDRNTVKLFEAVKRGQTKDIHEFIRLGADVNGRDEEGRTPIIIAAALRNNTVQSLLMTTDIDVNAADKLGRTALHFESAQGDMESVKQLLAHGASVDKKDLGGKTPLHCASPHNHVAVADILVFCGADGSMKDMKGSSPESVCETDAMKKVMEESLEIKCAIKQNYITINGTALRPGTTTYLASIGLTVTTPKCFYTPDLPEGWSTKREDFEESLDAHACFLCQRVRPEYRHNSLGADESLKELLISDTFQFRMSGAIQGKGIVQMAVPIFSRPEPYEELHIKTNKEPDLKEFSEELLDYERDGSSKQWQCRIEIDLREVNCFVLVIRPRVEHFKVGSKGGRFTSEVDDHIKIDVPEKSFSDNGVVTFEIISLARQVDEEHPKRADTQGRKWVDRMREKTEEGEKRKKAVPRPAYTNDELPINKIEVTSVSNFYELNHSKEEQPQNEVTMTLPLPRDYNGEDTSLYVLSRRKPEQDAYESEISLWEIIIINPKLSNGRTSFKLTHFSSKTLMEVKHKSKVESFFDSEPQISRNRSASSKTENTNSGNKLTNEVKSMGLDLKTSDDAKGNLTMSKLESDVDQIGTKLMENQQMKRGSVSSPKESQSSIRSHSSDITKPSKEKTLSRIEEREIKTVAAMLYKKACERKCKVSFVVMLKTKDESSYETLAECTTVEPEKRIDFWKMEGFEDQKPSHPNPNEFEVIPKTKFEFQIAGPVESILKQKLEFHPKRKGDNFTRFEVSRKKEGMSEAELKIVSKTDDIALGYVVMHLDGVNGDGSRLDYAKKDPGFKGFTNDAFLEDVVKELKDDWYQLGIKLGIARGHLNKIQKKENFKLKMLISWRNNCRYREDLGVRLLATGLKQIKRMDILEEVVEKKLDSWLQKNSNKEDSFTKWLEVARSREWEIPKGSPRPLSDGFLMALVDQVGLCMQLIHQLGVPSSVAHDVENDRIFFRKPERQMLELLGQAKKKYSTDIEFYKLLDETLGNLEKNDVKDWMRNVTVEWCENQTDKDGDALQQQLTSYLEEVEQEEASNRKK